MIGADWHTLTLQSCELSSSTAVSFQINYTSEFDRTWEENFTTRANEESQKAQQARVQLVPGGKGGGDSAGGRKPGPTEGQWPGGWISVKKTYQV
jgi:hypothetical protein